MNASVTQPLLKAFQLTKTYGDLQVLKGINLDIQPGEVVSIVGASGAGKSTLLQLLGTLDRPDVNPDTQLWIAGQDVLALNAGQTAAFRNQHLGFIFQFHQLLPEFTAIENVCIPAFIKGTAKAVAEQRAKELLHFLGFQQRISHKPAKLSGGEQQRVAVARALINQPQLVLADEPSGNLDTVSAHQLHQLFFDLRQNFGQTFVLVTHNLQLAQMADRTLTLTDGLWKRHD